MSQLKNDRFLRALLREPVDRTPVWIMRQAGRYLPEYRATRERAGSFMDLCTNAELACEVALQPLRRYPMDAAILFSDILTIPDALGLGLHFVEGEGPRFHKPVRTEADVAALSAVNAASDLDYVMNAVRTLRSELNGSIPLIGFSGSPWTLACYMVEGQGSRDFAQVKEMAFNQPEVMHQLLSVLADSVADYLRCQIEAGAQAVQIFDTWGGVLSAAAYREFSLDYMRKVGGGAATGTRWPSGSGDSVHQERWPLAGCDGGCRRGLPGTGLDCGYRRGANDGRQQGGLAGQHGPGLAARLPGSHSP